MEDGRWKMEDGRWKMEDGRWKMEDGRWIIRFFALTETMVASHQPVGSLGFSVYSTSTLSPFMGKLSFENGQLLSNRVAIRGEKEI
jgi:hypothetical protein